MYNTASECGLPVGTMVLTPTGHVPVETLIPGVTLLAISGSSAPFQGVVAVRRFLWNGPMVRIRAEALDDGAPMEDLRLPAGHGVLMEGTLIAAGLLVDGVGVVAEPAGEPVELVQVVLGGHDAILAAGAAVEVAPPHPDAPDCAPRRVPDAALRAMLSWRAEHMGWAKRQAAVDSPQVGTLRDRLEASPFTAAMPWVPPLRDPD